MQRRVIAILIPLVGLAACGDGSSDPTADCNADALPLSAETAAPTIVDITLEVQPSGILVLATATDPQGTPNLLNVVQSVGVFPDRRCDGIPIVRTDDLSGSGVEESFGFAVDAVIDSEIYSAIAAATSWPVEADFRDADDNRVSGRVFASVVQQP